MSKINYEELTQQAAKIKAEVSLLDYFFKLELLGELRFDGKQGKEYFFGFHHQKTGSISIRDQDNVWYDHSKGEGGDIIRAVQLFESKTFAEAINRLDQNTDINPDGYQAFYKQNGETEYKVSITQVLDRVQHPALIGYLHTRGLETKDIDKVAKEVHWTNGSADFFGVGVENRNGGFSVRSKIYKGNLNGGGISTFIIGDHPLSIKIFEGSMDLFSYRHLKPEESYHTILLNGTGNMTEKLSLNVLEKSNENRFPVHLYFDNGQGGRRTTEKALELIKTAEDKSLFYRETSCDDVNAYLMAQIPTLKIKR